MGAALERVVLVTGAASGIGAACARRLAAPGTGLLLHTRARAGELDAVAAQCVERGAQCRTVAADLAAPGAGAALVERALADFGRLDQIVSNAGFARAELDRALAAMAGAFYEMIGARRAKPALLTIW